VFDVAGFVAVVGCQVSFARIVLSFLPERLAFDMLAPITIRKRFDTFSPLQA